MSCPNSFLQLIDYYVNYEIEKINLKTEEKEKEKLEKEEEIEFIRIGSTYVVLYIYISLNSIIIIME